MCVLLASSAFILAIDFSIQRVTVWVSGVIRRRSLLALVRGGKRAGLYRKKCRIPSICSPIPIPITLGRYEELLIAENKKTSELVSSLIYHQNGNDLIVIPVARR